MNVRIISDMIDNNKIVIVCLLGMFVLSAVNGQQRWQHTAEDDAMADGRLLRHHQHQYHHQHKEYESHGVHSDVPYSQTINLRHHNRHHQHRQHRYPMTTTTTTAATTTTTTPKPTTTTTKEPVTPNLEEHRLRHSNKLYQPYAMVELKERYPQRRRSGQSTPKPLPAQHHRQTIGAKRPQNMYNVSTVMMNRYFDRDALYTIRQMTTTTPPPPPARIRHPYDVLKIPYKDRVHSLQKSDYDELDDDENTSWNSNDFGDGDMGDTDISNWIRQGRSKKMTKQLKSSGRRSSSNSDEFDMDDFDEDGEDDDDDEGDNNKNSKDNTGDVDTNRRLREQHSGDITYPEDDITSSAYIPGTLTNHKFNTLGTHDAVKESRRTYQMNQQQKQALAAQHATRIYSEATCRWPKPKVVAVQSETAKTYVPHCTILHRCGDDTGCCNTNARTCIARSTQSVDLYFYVSTLGSKQGTIEKQTFVNHTECQCVNKVAHRESAPPEPMRRATVISCTCPKLFEKVLQEDGTCRCDCSSGNYGCDWMKRGKEHFSMEDRKCIGEGRCKLPKCEYGMYEKRYGRCPRKEEKLLASISYRSIKREMKDGDGSHSIKLQSK